MLWDAFKIMFEHDRSATRGEVTLRGLYVFSHADKFGSTAAQTLFDLIRIPPAQDQAPRAVTPTTESSIDEDGIPAGVSLPARPVSDGARGQVGPVPGLAQVPLSALEHSHIAPGKPGLILLEDGYADDAATVRGTLLHQHVHEPGNDMRDGVRTLRALPGMA